MDIFSKLLNEVKIPKFVKINYTIKQSKIEDPAYEVKRLTYSPCLKAGDSWIQTILAY